MGDCSPLLPGSNPLGRPREVDLRSVWDTIQYIASAGCPWSLLPKDFPSVSTGRYYFYGWRDNGLLAEINRALVGLARALGGRKDQPTAGVIDSQSVKTTENGGIFGFDFAASEVNEATLRQLHRCEFMEGAQNVVLIGGPGTGKTHVATASPTAATSSKPETTASASRPAQPQQRSKTGSTIMP